MTAGLEDLDTATFVVGLIATGIAVIFHWTDRAGFTTRALALALFCLGIRMSLDYAAPRWLIPLTGDVVQPMPLAWLARILEGLVILAGIEWARRIGSGAGKTLRRAVNLLFRLSQAVALAYIVMSLLQLAIGPPPRGVDTDFLQTPPVRWAVMLPLLGTSMGLSALGILILLVTRTDPVESVRLRALALAAPFLLAGLVVGNAWIPITLAIGLLILLSGSVRYLIIQSERGQLMSQFISPEVARTLRLNGAGSILRRERRELSIVMADLRGFTRYAREHDSEEVVQLLERFYVIAGRLAGEHGATVKDHAGDGVLFLIGAPLPVSDHAQRAARLGLALSAELGAWLRQVAPTLGIGLGVATGSTTVGAIQGAGRLEYVAVGTAVNLAARLCQRAEPGEVLADQYTVLALAQENQVRTMSRAPEPIKGFDTEVPVYALAPVARAGAAV